MTRRRRIAALALLGVGLVAAPLGATLGSRGVLVVVTNTTAAPMREVVLSHPGGMRRLPRVEPGASAEWVVRRPLAGLRGEAREVPVAIVFTQRGDRSVPFTVRCELGWYGLRRLDLEIIERRTNRAVHVNATMNGHYEVSVRRLARNAIDPSIGPRRFYRYLRESIGRPVIPSRTPLYDATRQAGRHLEAAAIVLAVLLANHPTGTPSILREYAEFLEQEARSGRPLAPAEVRLPFRDLEDVMVDVQTSLVSSPFLP